MLVLNELVLPAGDDKSRVERGQDLVRDRHSVKHDGGRLGATRQDCQHEHGKHSVRGLEAASAAVV